MRNSHALAASYLMGNGGKDATLGAIERQGKLEVFRARVSKYSRNIPLLKVLVSIVLIILAVTAIHHDR